MRESLNIKGTLLYGVEFEGTLHKDFEVRPLLVKDSITAGTASVGKSSVYHEACLVACQLVSLGTIPKESITVDLLLEMLDDDYGEIQNARIDLQKKIQGPTADSKNSDSSSSS